MTLKFNDVSLPKWVAVTGVSFQTLPDLDVRKYRTARGIGEIDGGVRRGASIITLDVIIGKDKAENIHKQKDELKRWAKGNEWKPSRIIFDEEPDRFYLGRVSNNMEIDDLFTHGKTKIEFYCADPFKYNIKETVVTSTDNARFNYDGIEHVPLKVVAQFSKPVKNMTIQHIATQKSFTLLADFKAGETVTIDSSKRLVLLNGKPAMKLMSFDSDWLYTNTHNLQILILRNNTASTGISYQVSFREAY